MFQSWVSGERTAAEIAAAHLGDRRLESRAQSLIRDFSRAPAKSIPNIFRSSASREAAYRFFANESVDPDALLAAHIDQTLRRVASVPVVRVVHDTSEFSFNGDREGLATLKRGMRGFFGHFALAVGGTELREPLGVLARSTFINNEEGLQARRKLTRNQRDRLWTKTPREQKARHRWEKTALEVAAKLPSGTRAIHVMDQEADDFHVFLALTNANGSFVIRGEGTRLTEDRTTVSSVLESQPHQALRTIRINRRSLKASRHIRPVRDERTAELHIRFGPVVLRRPAHLKNEIPVETLVLNVVHVFEPNPPPGEERVEWVLFTTEPVASFEQALEIVDHYRARWIIEEFFKALKTGCSFEKRQLTTFKGLQRLLALLIPIAWQLLRIRYLARQPNPPPAEHVLDEGHLRLLRALLIQEKCDFRLPAAATATDVSLGIAALGGHIRQNGDPGWAVLGRGLEELLAAARGWIAAGNEK
jgi:hypothetical protein